MSAYYNEIDQKVAAWLRQLIKDGHIEDGEVDTRDIRDVLPADLDGFDRCHFFAGLGGWAYALQLAGYDAPCWTGSCPCQPFSSAGKRLGFDDERHLWPAWFWLIGECRPECVFGEQVASAPEWIDLVASDLEGIGYTCGAAILPAAGVGAPHLRERAWFVAHAEGFDGQLPIRIGRSLQEEADSYGRSQAGFSEFGNSQKRRPARQVSINQLERRRSTKPVKDAYWADPEWLPCTDGKLRPTKRGLCPVAPRLPGDLVGIAAFGNSIVPQVAAEFIKASIE